MYRRTLLAATATAVTSGCIGAGSSDTLPHSDISPTSAESVPDAPRSGWKTTTDGDGDALARSSSDLYLRVNQCSDASAAREYNVETDEATISFDYEVTAEQWWEHPYLRIYDSDTIIYDSAEDPIRTIARTEYGTITGSFETTVPVSDTITVEFGIEPTQYCENGDHANTYFRVNGLEISPGRPPWQTNRSGNATAISHEDVAAYLRVYKCARASAIKRIEETNEDVTISFDYEVTAEQWWERPYLRVYGSGTTIYDSGEDDDRQIKRNNHTTAAGTFEVTVSPDSEAEVELGIEPSQHCSNHDHANTHFQITNFSIG